MRKYLLAAAALTAVGALTLSACTSPSASGTGSSGSGAGVDGLWRMDGYGTVVAVGARGLTTYDVTAVSCLPGSLTGKRAGAAAGSDGGQRYTALGDRGVTEGELAHGRDSALTKALQLLGG